MTRPASYPDIEYYQEDLPLSWTVTLATKTLVNGVVVRTPIDLTDAELSAPVFDGGALVGSLTVDRTNETTGAIRLTFPALLGASLTRYAQWRFREDTSFNAALVQGRLVRL